MNKSSLRNLIVSSLVLLPFLLVTVATSKPSDALSAKTWSFTTNCSNASQTSGTIEVTSNSISSPSDLTFLSLGLPVSSLDIGNDNNISGEIAPSLTRTCTVSSGAVGDYTYTCSDNSIPSCDVTFTP